ncbi:MAG: hypothetical protein NWQ54_12725 [Paraglaciecola sp.]|nr:hypothetical protein [Paraglaciecola sp.]
MLGYIGALCVAIFCFAFTCYSIRTLRGKYGGDVRIVWYLFSLTIVISSIVGLWAIDSGAIDSRGSFIGETGGFINKLITATLDIDLSLTIVVTVLALILVPQILTYILSGIFGIAKSPEYVSQSITFLVWSMIKTFIVVSGVLLTILIFGFYNSWDSFGLDNIFGWLLLVVSFCFLSFLVLLLYRESKEFANDVKKFTPGFILEKLSFVHRKCTRHIKISDSTEK